MVRRSGPVKYSGPFSKHDVLTMNPKSNYAIVTPKGSGWRLDWKIELVKLVSRPKTGDGYETTGYSEDGHKYYTMVYKMST